MFSSFPHRSDEDGASAAEYGLLITGIAGMLVVVVFALGGQVSHMFDRTCDDLASRATASSC